MEAIRQIYEHGVEFVSIPPEFRHRRLEVIILPLEEKEEEANGEAAARDEAGASFYGCLPDFPEREPQGDLREVDF